MRPLASATYLPAPTPVFDTIMAATLYHPVRLWMLFLTVPYSFASHTSPNPLLFFHKPNRPKSPYTPPARPGWLPVISAISTIHSSECKTF
ncbi:hypothetical protein BGZ61DRAFT_469745 [Ilyonectria robusta]|uniref:uncharacterized protein n=1 Tax=Ilyonectria robusta TaxID=1079257 RepID=UPI001E8E528A|nr:uncharacterized protein BGZ61DRAFT_469745 [Ilyonectria robusta]KAH8648255.1 hypothetical protein BGZ61DRAFT_469745 [Ilyonectria robusta]